MDRHRFDTDPDPNLHLDADRQADPTPIFTHDGNQNFLNNLHSQPCKSTLVYPSRQRRRLIGVIIFKTLDRILKWNEKITLFEIDTDLDSAKSWCRSNWIQIRIHNTGHRLGLFISWEILFAVLGIRDILVRIWMRIRILGSVPLTNGSGCGSGTPKNIQIRIRMRIRNSGTFTRTPFFKDKKALKKSYKTVEIKVFLLFLLGDWRIRSWIRTCD